MLSIFKPYKYWLLLLLICSLGANGLALLIPRLSAKYIDQFSLLGTIDTGRIVLIIGGIILIVLLVTLIQFAVSTYLSERVGLDLRNRLIGKLKKQTHAYISETTSSTLLTNLTSDINAIKDVSSNGIVSLLSALFTFIGVIVLLLLTNVKLALLTFTVLPFLILTFFIVFGKIGALFKKGQENIERMYKVINETIIAAPLVRVLNAGSSEISKFEKVNGTSRALGLEITAYFSALIPVITFLANATTVIILWFGGKAVIEGMDAAASGGIVAGMTLGELSAFFAYSSMFIWPIFVLGFTGSLFQRANISFGRIKSVLDAPVAEELGIHSAELKGDIEFKNVHLELGKSTILKDVSFSIKAKTKNAIVGPTAAGKTQLFHLIAGLIKQTSGDILIDGVLLKDWNHSAFISQIGLVFQDSIVFNTTLRENVDFRKTGDEEAVRKALAVAELGDLLEVLPKGLDSLLNERGTNLSGGQKQRLMLARALAQNPKVLLLDDFTARVDIQTEQTIIENIRREYPSMTLVSITQKIDPIKDYDQIIVLMEGEILDMGTHDELIGRSVEYKQIYQSQQKAHD